MKRAEKTKQELLEENALLKAELNMLKDSVLNFEKSEDIFRLEHQLNLHLTNALPYGVYRIRVFSNGATSEQRWSDVSVSSLHVEFINDRFCEILNIDKQLYRKNPEILIESIFEEDKADFAKRNAEANLKLIPFKWEGRLHVEGNIIWVCFESLPDVLENGDVIWTGILYDNSERKKAEQEIVNKNQELKKMNSEKDKFFSIIAHDLKSPFNSIMGLSELLSEKIRVKDHEGIAEYAEVILHSSQRAINLLMNLMDWSQSRTGRMDFHPERFDMDTVIDDNFLLFEEIAKQKTITLIKKLPTQIYIQADKVMVSTVVRNLICNAIKFTMPGGEITVSTKIIDNELNVSISDTGVGIPKNTIEKIFRLESNITTSGTQNEQGTGLGLVLCKEFIEKHHGKIWFESELKIGSTFYFSIPLVYYKDNK